MARTTQVQCCELATCMNVPKKKLNIKIGRKRFAERGMERVDISGG